MRYACLIYYDPKELFGGSPEANAALEECEGHDEVLKAGGNFVLGEALEMPENAMTVRMREGKMSSTDGLHGNPGRCLAGSWSSYASSI